MNLRIYAFIIPIALMWAGCNPLRRAATESPDTIVHGYTAPGFEKVRSVFIENFISRGERGAALTVYYGDTIVVNLYGGYKNKQKELFDSNTLILFFSASKGMMALAAACAVSDGLFDYSDKISQHWPAFSQNGKEHITVEQMLCHQAGIPLLDKRIKKKHYFDTTFIRQTLLRQTPKWTPGEKQGYHLYTTGLYLNELIKETDTMHRSIDTYFYERLAQSAGVEFYFGLPDTLNRDRLAHIIHITTLQRMFRFWQLPRPIRLKVYNPFSMLNKTFRVLIGFNPNKETFLRTLLPTVNGVGKVSDVAKLYHMFAIGGEQLNIRPEVLETLYAPPHLFGGGNLDYVLGLPMFFKSGFRKPSDDFRFGTSVKSFGMSGAGGSFAFADPELKLGYCYAPTLMKGFDKNDPREEALREAVYECIGEMGGSER